MNARIYPGPLLRILSLFCLIFVLGPLHTRADIANLRAKGPKSGSLFSFPGLSETSANIEIAMRDAQVKILLKKGEGNTLLAECEANFLMENLAPAQTGPQDFLVAFPVTGLNSKFVMIDKFAVTVDGKTPPTVFRQAITTYPAAPKLGDTPIAGQLDASFAAEKSTQMPGGPSLSDKSIYQSAYIWSQHTVPGTKTKVKINYTVTLRPQPIHYIKSFQRSADDREVIPFDDINVDGMKGDYYFFDYILLSGSTWDGPIGHEIIELVIDPELHLPNSFPIRCTKRSPVGHHMQPPKTIQQSWSFNEDWFKENSIVMELNNEKPTYDLLFAIPVEAISLNQKK